MQRTERPAEPHGLSQEELEQIAAEVGLDPAFIQTALAELDAGVDEEEGFHFWGGPIKIEEELVIDGEVSEDQWAAMVPEIRQALGSMGSIGRLGRGFELIHKNNANQEISVTVTPHNGRSRMTIFTKGVDIAGGLFGGMGSAAFALCLITVLSSGLPVWLSLPGALVVMTSVFMLIRLGYGTWARKQKRTYRQLLKKMGALGEQAEAPAQEKTPLSGKAAPLLDLNAEAPDAAQEEIRARTRS